MNEQQIERVRYVKPGETLAMASSRLHHDRRGFFWMMGSGRRLNERKGDVTIVHVRGELEHHKDDWCSVESYEGILEKMRAAYSGQDYAETHEREHRYDDDYQPIAATPPAAIVMCVDSPGGVVSGLNECVRELRRMRNEHPEIKVFCYVDEMATSAAYALACSCDEIVCPPSAIIGSIGVISTMISQAKRDAKEGFDVRLLTSGARKADGHLHAPISDAAVEVETKRVEKLAKAFFSLVNKARGVSVDKLRSLQAGIFLGKDAIREGLADTLSTFGDLVAGAQSKNTVPAAAGGNQTDRRLNGARMNLTSLIKKTKAALAATDDPAKIAALSNSLGTYAAALEAYKKTEKHIEHVKTEEGDEDGDEEEEAEEKSSEEEEKASKSSEEEEKASTAAKADDDGDDGDDDDDGDEDDAKSAKKALALVKSITGMSSPKKAFGALQAIAMTAANTAADVVALKKESAKREKASLIAEAKGKYLTPSEAKWLAGQPMATVKGFVEMRRKAGVIVNTDDTTIIKPKSATPGTEESLPEYTRSMIDAAVATMPKEQREKGRAELVAAHLKSHNDQMNAAMNGASGRY